MAVREASRGNHAELVFPLVPSRRSGRLDVAGRTTRRRGSGGETAGSRPYRRGDAVRLVDWRASARISSARGRDEFVVRERFAEDVVRVLLIVDRGPTMRLFPPGLPWLHKNDAVHVAGTMILASAQAAHALVGYVEGAPHGPWLARPGRDPELLRIVRRRLAAGAAHGAAAGVSGAITRLARLPTTVTPGTFVFVLSDFLVPPPADVLRSALGAGWDLVPVIVQDPVWERSFPDVAGATLPLADPESGVVRPVRLSSAEVGARRDANEQRAARLQETFLALGVDPVLAGTAEPRDVHAAFLAWARARLTGRRHR